MTFKLQPGDYIRTSSVPDNKKQAVIDAFVAAGATRDIEDEILWSCDFVGWWIYRHDKSTNLNASNSGTMKGFEREVTLDQILGQPTLFEAATTAPNGTVFKVPPSSKIGLTEIVKIEDNDGWRLAWKGSEHVLVAHSFMGRTDYEIIPADPVPWVPSEGDTGWVVGPSFGTHPQTYVGVDAFRTREGAKHAAKILRVVNAICNMPGAPDRSQHNMVINVNKIPDVRVIAISVAIPFHGDDADQSARHAADYANNLINEMQGGES